ncbi:MAG: hypothetical protein ABR84_02290 [Cryomorphaceae bacterium BACL21 MAG-121220-bin10]|jgi:uncharacterized protein (TIGR02453 family)|nr:MAG: hypothetical protein ABR84_02290 [Cryomorphaceae bacterium BACL21 MAG-121220-bin10]
MPITNADFSLLRALNANNNRPWMQENKAAFVAMDTQFKKTYAAIFEGLNENDVIEKFKTYRIYRDIRFSKNKTPFHLHRSVSFMRQGAQRRGSYYLRIEPGNSYMAAGFFGPNPTDLLRIRKEMEYNAQELRDIIREPLFANSFKELVQIDRLKTTPKGFDKHHPDIDLMRLKHYYVQHAFSDQELLGIDFTDQFIHLCQAARPFLDLMSAILTTDLNGVSLLDLEN